jgi:hypothetical protein
MITTIRDVLEAHGTLPVDGSTLSNDDDLHQVG